ncbi:serine hydrolase [Robiginitalea sp. M366]|uniref:serine hydrolase domain-containing protein n=1 Tax=Robiginitalea aestuariiviva TaxID=3036903 RepID=UPI00240E0789|nr:serine hydrolase [Robiginitalea aestuariiviva]MDG1572469.1 serine hydrolase [Robiginitalea aestuariiviva]
MRHLILLTALLGLFSAHVNAQEFPIPAWERDTVAAGWDRQGAREYFQFIRDSSVVTGLMVVQHGKVVFQYGDLQENSYIASCRKSVLAMLYGEYVENGTIDLDQTIEALGIDDVKGILPIEKQATVQDLISARSGVYHPEGYPGGMQEYAPERGSVKPGEYWLYSNWDFNVAGYVFEQQTGQNIYDEVQRQLALPLGMQDWDRSLQQKQGDTTLSRYLAYPMWFSTRDMARIGLLMLHKGKWQDQRLISEAWVQEMITQRTPYKEVNRNVPNFRDTGVNLGYGYMWWLFEDMNDPRFEGAYAAMGAMGQAIAVFPAIDAVVTYKTKAAYRRVNSGQTRLDLLKKAVALYTPE